MSLEFEKRVIEKKIQTAVKLSTPILSQQILKDSNFYARQDSGAMIASSQSASKFRQGILIWNTPYAAAVYYTGEPSKDVNPNASLMWFEKAKSLHLEEWLKLADKEVKKRI